MPIAQRSVVPTVPGVPAWGAVAIAAVAAFAGFALDAVRGAELTGLFSVFYFLGCVAAVLAVRNRGVFTAMVQPPLLLVVAIPLAYRQLSPGSAGGMKDLLFNVAIPLVNRFPLMLSTTLVVLALGAGRMYVRRQAAGVIARPGRRADPVPRTRATDGESGEVPSVPGSETTRRRDRPSRPATVRPATDRHPVPNLGDDPAEQTESFDRPAPVYRARTTDRPRADDRRRPDRTPTREPADPRPATGRRPAAARPRPAHDPRDALERTQVQQYDQPPRHTGPAYPAGQSGPRTARHEYRAEPDVPAHPVPQVRYRDSEDNPPERPHRYRR